MIVVSLTPDFKILLGLFICFEINNSYSINYKEIKETIKTSKKFTIKIK